MSEDEFRLLTRRDVNSAPVSIRLSPLDSPALPRSLRGRLALRRAELLNGLVCASDWGDYQKRIGWIGGFDEAILIAEQIEKDLNGER